MGVKNIKKICLNKNNGTILQLNCKFVPFYCL